MCIRDRGDTVENLLKEPEPTELISFQEMMVECRREQFPQPVENSFEKAREEMINDIRLWREEIIQQWREEMKNDNKPAEKRQDINTLSSENEFDRNQEDIQYKEIDAEGIKKTQVIKEAEELLAEKEELEQNNLHMCDDQGETKELP